MYAKGEEFKELKRGDKKENTLLQQTEKRNNGVSVDDAWLEWRKRQRNLKLKKAKENPER